jgi:hypothetical protein
LLPFTPEAALDTKIANLALSDYVMTFDAVLSPENCRALIDRFEASPGCELTQREEGHSFTQLNITEEWPDVAQALTQLFFSYFNKYQAAVNAVFWPEKFSFEHLRIKRYLPNGRDSFPTHVDVMDKSASERFMTAFIYLNTPDGGETTFDTLGLSVSPVEGKMIVFPPLWLFPHAGLLPKTLPKYILHTYLHYS